jgi:hypothetical protein
MRLRASPQGRFEAGPNLLDDRVAGEHAVTGVVDDEELARLRLGTPRRVEGDEVPPRVSRPDGHDAHIGRRNFEVVRNLSRDISVGEEGLGIAGGHEIDLAVGIELADGIQRPFRRALSQRKGRFQLTTLGLGRATPGQDAMGVLPGHTEARRQIGHGKAFPAQKRLPYLGFIAHRPRS